MGQNATCEIDRCQLAHCDRTVCISPRHVSADALSSLGLGSTDGVVWPACERLAATPPCEHRKSHPIAQQQEPRVRQLANVIDVQVCPDLRPAVVCPTIHAAAARAEAEADAELEAGRRKLEEWLHTVLGDGDNGSVFKTREAAASRRKRAEAALHRESSHQAEAVQLLADGQQLHAGDALADANIPTLVSMPTLAVASSAPPPVGPPDPGINTPASPEHRLPPVSPEVHTEFAECANAEESQGRAFEEALSDSPLDSDAYDARERIDYENADVQASDDITSKGADEVDAALDKDVEASTSQPFATTQPIEAEADATPPESSPTSSETPVDDEAYTHSGPTETYGFTLYHISATAIGEPETPGPPTRTTTSQNQKQSGFERLPSKTRNKRTCKELRSASDLLLW